MAGEPGSGPAARPHPRRGPAIAAAVLLSWVAVLWLGGRIVLFASAWIGALRGVGAILFFLSVAMSPWVSASGIDVRGRPVALSTATALVLFAVLWSGVAAAFARLGRRLRLGTLLWLAPVVIIAVTVLVNVALSAAGIGFRFDLL